MHYLYRNLSLSLIESVHICVGQREGAQRRARAWLRGRVASPDRKSRLVVSSARAKLSLAQIFHQVHECDRQAQSPRFADKRRLFEDKRRVGRPGRRCHLCARQCGLPNIEKVIQILRKLLCFEFRM